MGHLLTHLQICNVVREYRRTGNVSQTARITKHDRKTVKRWADRLEKNQIIQRKPGSGRKPAMDDDACALAESLLLDSQYGSLKEVAAELHRRKQLTVSTKTLSKSVKSYCKREGRCIKVVFKRPKKQLTADTKQKRLKFCETHKSTKWNAVMFTDRCKFHFYYPGAKVGLCQWVRQGEDREAPKVNHASCLNVYAGITKYGVTAMCTVAGTTNHDTPYQNKKGDKAKNITSAEYYHVVLDHLLPEGKRLFAGPHISSWYLQQDNDPTHRKSSVDALKVWESMKTGTTVTLLPHWPPNSPDLSPIENVWAYVQGEVNKKGCKTYDEFAAQVKHTFQNLPKGMIANLYKSMKTRLQQCMQKQGGKTKY